ncbi:MAG: hypothetical protein IPJ41_05570 [Phycisphaerales bacterium]|nr:hypothetical protein [Phycisphaerales bacterium]
MTMNAIRKPAAISPRLLGLSGGLRRAVVVALAGGCAMSAFAGGGGPGGGAPCPYIITPIVHYAPVPNFGSCDLYIDCETEGESCENTGVGIYEDCGTETQRFALCVQYSGGTYNSSTGQCEGGTYFDELIDYTTIISEFQPVFCGGGPQ